MKPGGLLLLCWISLQAFPQGKAPDTSINGISIISTYDTSFFPASWQVSPVNARGTKIDPQEAKRSIEVITRGMKKYPVNVLQQNLHAVYLFSSLRFYGVNYGGTNSNEALYLTNDGTENGYTDYYLEQIFHHEFSSILLRNFKQYFKPGKWEKINGKDFTYEDPENGVGAIRNHRHAQEMDTLLSKSGFLTQYALSSMENDLNTIVQFLFCPVEPFRRILAAYPRVHRKVRQVIRFYHRVDPFFSKKYFRRLTVKTIP
jgi:hypothetical protein